MSIVRLAKTKPSIKLFITLLASLLMMPTSALAEYAYNFQTPVTEIAGDLLWLHNTIFFVCLTILFLVSVVMFYSIIAHRKSRGHKAAQFHDNTTYEIIWTIIPFIILVIMAVPSTAKLLKMDDVSHSDITVKITGYQWKWKYDYLDHDISFFSTLSTPREQIENKVEKGEHYLLEVDNPLVLPVGKKVRFVLTSNDVIHAWWVPQLGIKKDAIPGYINEMWTKIDKPGVYRGQCAELCGKDHGFMPIVVKAVSEQEFNAWASMQRDKMAASQTNSDKTWATAELIERGKKVYGQNCAACHGATGGGVPGVFPAMTASKIATGAVDEHINIVFNGKAGTAMQAFKDQFNDIDLAAVITFERNGLGNSTGDTVQPAQIKALR